MRCNGNSGRRGVRAEVIIGWWGLRRYRERVEGYQTHDKSLANMSNILSSLVTVNGGLSVCFRREEGCGRIVDRGYVIQAYIWGYGIRLSFDAKKETKGR